MTSCRSPPRTTVVALAAATVVSSTFAVSLRPNKATDDSVCDLAHDTNLYLGSKTLVPSVASKRDHVDAFFRLAATFVASKCRNGQTLILQGATASSIDVQSLTEVANSACAVASVVRTEVKLPLGDVTQPHWGAWRANRTPAQLRRTTTTSNSRCEKLIRLSM